MRPSHAAIEAAAAVVVVDIAVVADVAGVAVVTAAAAVAAVIGVATATSANHAGRLTQATGEQKSMTCSLEFLFPLFALLFIFEQQALT